MAASQELLDATLEELVRSAETVPELPSRQQMFSERYRGQAVIFDTLVSRDDKRGGGYEVGFGVVIDERPVELDFRDFRLFDGLGIHRPERVIFGARLDAVAKSGEGWRIRFKPESGVLISRPKLLESLGWPVEGEWQRQVEQQAQRWSSLR